VLAAATAPDLWRWQPHPEVWALIAGLALLYRYAIRSIGPTATRPGEVIVTRGQVAWFATGLGLLWIASDWPMHDIAEQWLYSVHMTQHLLLSLVIPPMLLLGTPTWLARLVVGSGRGYRVVRWLTRLVPASLAFNAVVVLSHWPKVVELSVTYAPVHFGLHLLVVVTSLLMWFGVAGPLPELRFTLPVQMAHLFLQSVVPTVPAGFLVFADSVIYKSYDRVGHIWGMTAVEDQQIAAALMKVIGGLYLWSIIVVLFTRFAERSQADDRERGVTLDRRAPALTWAEVEAELATAPPAPQEPSH
jgi:putative membrane protein